MSIITTDRIPQAKTPLKVVVVGAGIGGVAASLTLGLRGHHVVIVEAAPKLLEVGAGIQVSPNMYRLLQRWGVTSIKDTAIPLQQIDVRRWQNGNLLSVSPANTAFGESFTIHRADLHNALIDRALALENIELWLNSLVTDVRFDSTEIVLADGTVISGDVIIAADGIKSIIRGKLLNDTTVKPTATGDAAYRIVLPRSKMLSNPELKQLVEAPKAIRWIGPARHIIAYPVRNHQLYNVVLLHPDRGTVDESWTTRGSKQQMADDYAGWDEKVRQIVSMVEEDEVLEWKLCLYPPLKTWTRGSVALMGDSCHPMLPYVAQGAAQAVEDAAALGIVLSNISSPQEIPLALQAYERSRKQRAETVQQSGSQNRITLHLPDGPEQQVRDEQFRLAMEGGVNPDRWVDRETQRWLWGWDAEAAAMKVWDELVGNKVQLSASL